MLRWKSSRTAVVGVAVVVFVVGCVFPVGYLVGVSLTRFDVLSAILLDARQLQLLFNTALLGFGTALLATAIGVPLGATLARVTLPQKGLLRIVLAAPLLLPPYIVGLAWTYLGSQLVGAGLIGRELVSEWTYSLPATILVLSVVLYPISMLATEAAMRRVDGRLEEAALLVAPLRRVLRRITLPLVAPGVCASALVIFVLAISEFGVPGLLRVRVYTTEVFTAFAALYDFSRAIVLAVPLLLLCLSVAIVAAALLGDRLVTTRRTIENHALLLDAWSRPAGVSVAVMVVIALIVPIGILVNEAMDTRSLSAVVAGSGSAMANSLFLATTGATLVVLVAIGLGYGRARAGRRLGRLGDIMFVVAFGVPGTIVGVGLIGLWNRPGVFGTVYGTDAMFMLGYLARLLPLAALAVAATTRTVPISHEEAATASGAGWLRTMRRIVLPQMRLGLAAAWVIVFVLAFGELGVSILIAPPGEATLPIRVYTIIANAPPSDVAALALLQAGAILVPLAILAAAVSLRPSTGAQGSAPIHAQDIPNGVETRDSR